VPFPARDGNVHQSAHSAFRLTRSGSVFFVDIWILVICNLPLARRPVLDRQRIARAKLQSVNEVSRSCSKSRRNRAAASIAWSAGNRVSHALDWTEIPQSDQICACHAFALIPTQYLANISTVSDNPGTGW
jgi:hypothetical protein